VINLPQALTNIVNVTVQVSPLSVVNSAFNLGLIIGSSAVISTINRVKVYSGTDDMLANGWIGTEPEYLAAQIYFSQKPRPNKVAIGRQDLAPALIANPTAAPTLATVTVGGVLPAATYYVRYSWVSPNGETMVSPEANIITTGTTSTVTVTIPALPAGATLSGIYIGTAVGTGTKQGTTATTSYTQSAALVAGAAAPGTNTTNTAETPVIAVAACRSSNTDWYAVYVCDSAKTNILTVAAYIETATPLSVYFYDTRDAEVLAGTAGNVMATLQTLKHHRSWGQYSTPLYAAASAMGYAMGANTGLANSAYTLAYKSEPGILPEVLNTTQANTILGYNGNIYTSYGASYNLLVQGTMADGVSFDEVLNIDVLTNAVQTAIMNALTSAPKVPQTEDGVSLLVSAITVPCSEARNRGAIAPGVWKAGPILGLKTGDTLSTGYMVLADSLANQSQADRDARKSPPIYVAIKMAGAIEHIVIGIIVNR
jgi:hypothetical protein